MVSESRQLDSAALGPPRFALRTLMLAMVAVSCLMAVGTAVGTASTLMLLFFVGLIVAHVLGNSLGTKLRDRATTSIALDSAGEEASRKPVQPTKLLGNLTHGQLGQHKRLSRVAPAMACGGAVLGAFAGGTGSALIYPEAGAAPVALGVCSAAVLGGLGGFLASSFVTVILSAWREALKASEPHHRPS
ncbi:MAG TPA: DUF5325 family protein [Pirellulales bacterium]|jgi:hypothetical protein